MTLKEAANDHSIKSIRLPSWANPSARLELPVVVGGARGPWFKLIDGVEVIHILCIYLQNDVSDAWEVVERYPHAHG